MQDLVRIAIDAMGGDNAPAEPVKAAVEALEKTDRAHIFLVGRENDIRENLKGLAFDESRLTIVPATEMIEMAEHPVNAIRKKKDSSIVLALRMIRNKEADAFISAGSTGAVLAGGQLLVGRLPGVERAPLAPLLPTLKGVSLLIDCGANVDARPNHLVQFAKMGSLYMRDMMGIENPTVGLLNIGVEEEKGNALSKETYPLLKACPDINFIGNVESREIPHGAADVIVTDAFAGNVALKLYEGTASAFLKMIKGAMMSNFKSKMGALLVKDSLKKTLKTLDATEYGGAPMLGLNGLVVKAHGNATHKELCNAVLQCVSFTDARLTEKIKNSISLKENGEEQE
ncbi:MAG: phosphate acyltransferase PlsX [Lachnospiraceae bacterium]|nr:phosphate acyltransferase PlsX [Lachnospiraceae bacterium]